MHILFHYETKITFFYLIFAFIRFHLLYHSLSFIITRFITRCQSLYHSLPLAVTLVVTPCHSLYHSLSVVVIRCYSLYHLLSLVVTQCTTCLSFYKRSLRYVYVIFLRNFVLTVHKYQIIYKNSIV